MDAEMEISGETAAELAFFDDLDAAKNASARQSFVGVLTLRQKPPKTRKIDIWALGNAGMPAVRNS